MADEQPGFFDPIASADRRAVAAALLGIALAAAFQYQGQPAFFALHVAHRLPETARGDLAARLWWIGAAAVVYLGVPLALGRALLGASPRALGFAAGDWRYGLRVAAVAMAALTPVLWLSSADPGLRTQYPTWRGAAASPAAFALWAGCYALYYISLEHFWRGYFQIGLGDRIGAANALLVQVGAACLVHWGKPELETLASVLSGTLFGLLAWRTRSFLWPALIHWYVGVANDLFCSLRGPP